MNEERQTKFSWRSYERKTLQKMDRFGGERRQKTKRQHWKSVTEIQIQMMRMGSLYKSGKSNKFAYNLKTFINSLSEAIIKFGF